MVYGAPTLWKLPTFTHIYFYIPANVSVMHTFTRYLCKQGREYTQRYKGRTTDLVNEVDENISSERLNVVGFINNIGN